MKHFLCAFFYSCLIFVTTPAFAQKIQSGPMVGHISMIDAKIWVQTDQAADVSVSFYALDSVQQKHTTDIIRTQKDRAFTATFVLERLVPGVKYAYSILINGKEQPLAYPTQFTTQALWQYRTDPPTFSFAMGSCTYINEPEVDRPGTPYGGDYHIFNTIDSMNPDMMLWLGDNIYLREVDYASEGGFAHRYTHTRSTKELQPLLARRPNYAIWDDHDFGPNDANGSFALKETALEYFKMFWANPSYGLPDFPGSFGAFTFHDLEFFMLDNRTYRTPQWKRQEMRFILGRDQTEWLIAALKTSKAAYKMVCVGGQVLNTAKKYENHAQYPSEREYLLKRIEEEGIKGVVFLTGDRHHTELSEVTLKEELKVWDITASPLTSRANTRVSESNENRVAGTLVQQRNFAVVKVSGTRLERVLTISVYDSNGGLLWAKQIKR